MKLSYNLKLLIGAIMALTTIIIIGKLTARKNTKGVTIIGDELKVITSSTSTGSNTNTGVGNTNSGGGGGTQTNNTSGTLRIISPENVGGCIEINEANQIIKTWLKIKKGTTEGTITDEQYAYNPSNYQVQWKIDEQAWRTTPIINIEIPASLLGTPLMITKRYMNGGYVPEYTYSQHFILG
jgi:hypothetical protein